MLMHDYEIIHIDKHKYEEVIHRNNIKKVIIDNDIYELDHAWYDESRDSLLSYLKSNYIKTTVIKNSQKNLDRVFLECEVFKSRKDQNDNFDSSHILLNEDLFNPMDTIKNIDIVYLHFNKIKNTPYCKLFRKDENFIYKDILLDGFKYDKLLYLIKILKNTKVLYINFDVDIDNIILQYIINISNLYNVFVVCDYQYNMTPKYTYNSYSDISNFSTIKIVLNNEIYKDKILTRNIRNIFINNTFFNEKSTKYQLQLINCKSNLKHVSVITSTNRKENIYKYLKQLSKQNFVKLQVILNTHGFSLDENMKNKLIEKFDMEIIFLEAPKDYSLGKCLNLCIDYIKYPIVAKMDDDDFYCPNYLIDQCISLNYSKADVVGKLSQFIYLEAENITIKRLSEEYYKYVDLVMGASLVCKTVLLKKYLFKDLNKGEDADLLKRIKQNRGRLFANHPYDFCIFRGFDKDKHTWKISDLAMLKSSKIICYGNSLETLCTEN